MKIVVVGSINADLMVQMDQFPQVGETVLGKDFSIHPGGKGANQAVAAKKLQAEVSMIGCVGEDAHGDYLLANFQNVGVNVEGVRRISNVPSGVAPIFISSQDNMIVVVPGANHKVSKEDIDANIQKIKEADVIMTQFEIPMETIDYLLDKCDDLGKMIIVNPAPYQPFDLEWMRRITFLTPNQVELEKIFQKDKESVLRHYPNQVILTAGEDGAYFHDGFNMVHIEADKTEVVDTTGAGDTFNGALATLIAQRKPLNEAVAFAVKAASCAVKKRGAQSAMPTLEELV
ncbi:MAG TPA: ribokinase [Erysipelotrichaceae bacterium]|nr:ribokinase [Erysipelotrichaceae bacterium]